MTGILQGAVMVNRDRNINYHELTINFLSRHKGIILMVIPFAAQTVAAWIIGINLVLDGVLNICVVLSTVKTIRRKRLEN